ncbi:DUF317 domain-containing protein [Streptomyces exfoliatus]|uniref:DUF317 domain-containing protein n=1 Tax=Streptomyces exfoliatus TaxID=1905 RepID=UPI003C2BFA43
MRHADREEHLHADDGQNTVAVGSYATGVRRHVHLHGENHLRQVSTWFDTEAEAVAEFHRLYSVAVRPGPAPLTDLEQAVRQLLAVTPPDTTEQTSAPAAEPPVAGPGEHEAFLAAPFDEERQWEKYRPFDETTIASHESLSVRVEFDHEARHRSDVAWTIAECDGPVGERLWHATLTVGTPVPLIRAMLQHLDAPPLTTADGPDDVLHDAAWHPASHPARTTWSAPGRSVVFESPHAVADRWTLYGGEDLGRAAWTIRLSAGAPTDLLAQLAGTAADLLPPPTRPTPSPLQAPAPGSPHPRPPSAPWSVRCRRCGQVSRVRLTRVVRDRAGCPLSGLDRDRRLIAPTRKRPGHFDCAAC